MSEPKHSAGEWLAIADAFRKAEASPGPIVQGIRSEDGGTTTIEAIANAVFAKLADQAPAGASPPTFRNSSTAHLANVPRPISPSAPQTAVPLERSGSAFEMGRDDVAARFSASVGYTVGENEIYSPRFRAARRQIRNATVSEISRTRVRFGR